MISGLSGERGRGTDLKGMCFLSGDRQPLLALTETFSGGTLESVKKKHGINTLINIDLLK